MIISLYIFIAWLLGGALISSAKVIPHKQLAFVFLFSCFVNTNLYYLFGETFKAFKISDDPSRYVSFSLLLSFIVPAILAIGVNAYYVYRSAAKKMAALCLSIGAILGLEVLNRLLKIITYDSYLIMAALFGYRLLLTYASFLALRGFKRMCPLNDR